MKDGVPAMSTRFKTAIFGASALAMGALPAAAADLIPPPPAPGPSCFYLRGDIGISVHDRPHITELATMATNPRINETFVVDAGVGCKLTRYFRMDVTGGYRHDAAMSEHFNDLDADISVYTGLVNGYIDFGNWNGLVPYVGAGVGVAHHVIDNVRLPADAADGSSTDFAWALYGGMAFNVNENLAFDVGYRYMDLGRAESGATPAGAPFVVEDYESHDFRIGIRWSFSSY